MRFNSSEMLELSLKAGDQEGRMTHKPPARTLYDSAHKERWFKLKGNLLFFYRLNDHGAVEKNEPHGVFVLENIIVERDIEDLKSLYGFTITWKDEPYKKHYFYTFSENHLQNWITKLSRASYDNLRADLLFLRLQIEQKSGKDPLQHLGTPLPVRAVRGMLICPSKATSSSSLNASSSGISSSSSFDLSSSSVHSSLSVGKERKAVNSAPTSPFPTNKFDLPPPPLPPPRIHRGRKASKGKSCFPLEETRKTSRTGASFKSHIKDSSESLESSFKNHIEDSSDSLESLKSTIKDSSESLESSFKSHIQLDSSDWSVTGASAKTASSFAWR